jgi:hypothetical protein
VNASKKPEMFSADPRDIPGAAEMTKKGLKKALKEVQWQRLAAERDRRRTTAASARAAAAEAAGGAAPAALPPPPPLPDAAAVPRILIDCAFEELMKPAERTSLTRQLLLS